MKNTIMVLVVLVLLFVFHKTNNGEKIDYPILKEIQEVMEKFIKPETEIPDVMPGISSPEMESSPLPSPDETFYEDYDEAVKLAQKQSKNIFLVFHATWCGPCREFKSSTLDNRQVAQLLHPYIKARIDVDQHRELTGHFNVTGIPSFFLITPDGTKIKSGSGQMSVKEFQNWLR